MIEWFEDDGAWLIESDLIHQHGEGEGDSRDIEKGTESSKVLYVCQEKVIGVEVYEWVQLKFSPMKGVTSFFKKGKLRPRYIGPYRISKIGEAAYELEPPQELAAVHQVFGVSMLKKCMGDPSLIVPT